MLSIYDRASQVKIAVLQNAYNVTEEELLNGVSTLKFTLPDEDPKNEYCMPLNYVRWGSNNALYRLLDVDNAHENAIGGMTYTCEHVIATLIDDVIFGPLQIENWDTRTVLEYILNRQRVQHWRLGDCHFTMFFSYFWSNENLITAVFSVPNLFDTLYKWEFDTLNYPWTIHLRRLDEEAPPEYYLRSGRNLLGSRITRKGSNLCTRLYALGYGEGINQLTFAEVNNGLPYIDAAPSIIAKYGIIQRIWEDGTFENAESLLERARVILDGLSKPYEVITVRAADIEKRTREEFDTPRAGKIIWFNEVHSYINRVVRRYDAVGEDQIDIANAPEDIAASIADQANRARINRVYAQGQTVPMTDSRAENCDATHPLVMEYYVPSEARIVNKVIVQWRFERFRADSTGAAYDGGSTQTSSSGGGGSTTSESGGGTTSSGTSGSSSQYSTQSATSGFDFQTSYASGSYHNHLFPVPQHLHAMEHTHNVSVYVPPHYHGIYLPTHSHNVTIPTHTHAIQYGIYEGPRATSVTLRVDGSIVSIPAGTSRIDVVEYLSRDNEGKVRRDTSHIIELIPNSLTRITCTMYTQMFIQSEGGVIR